MSRRKSEEKLREILSGDDVAIALDEAHLAIDEYYNGDRAWAERWPLKAYEANQSGAAATPIAWRMRHRGGTFWKYMDLKPEGPSVELFEVQALYAMEEPK